MGQCTRYFSDDEGASACAPCAAGRFQYSIGMATCSACPKGKVSTKPASLACTVCDDGTYQSKAGQSACAECSSGQVSNDYGTGCDKTTTTTVEWRVSCEGYYTNWTECSATCGGDTAREMRTWMITQEAQEGG